MYLGVNSKRAHHVCIYIYICAQLFNKYIYTGKVGWAANPDRCRELCRLTEVALVLMTSLLSSDAVFMTFMLLHLVFVLVILV